MLCRVFNSAAIDWRLTYDLNLSLLNHFLLPHSNPRPYLTDSTRFVNDTNRNFQTTNRGCRIPHLRKYGHHAPIYSAPDNFIFDRARCDIANLLLSSPCPRLLGKSSMQILVRLYFQTSCSRLTRKPMLLVVYALSKLNITININFTLRGYLPLLNVISW